MEVLYYLLIMILVLGVPFLVLGFIILAVKPALFKKGRSEQWSRRKIISTGAATTFVAIVALSLGINGTMPQSVRNDIEARNAAAKELQANEQKKAQVQSAPELKASEVKFEQTKSSVPFATIEKTDAALVKGQRKVTTPGVEGERMETHEVTYVDGKETGRKLVKSEVTKLPVDEVVSVGTYVAPTPKPAPKATVPPASDDGSSTYYANCTAARNAGVTPIYRGQPGYRAGLDRDSDGVACE